MGEEEVETVEDRGVECLSSGFFGEDVSSIGSE